MKIEIVSTEKGHHARIKGDNGEIVWVTEVHNDKRDSEAAVQMLTDSLYAMSKDSASEVFVVEYVIEAS